MKVHLIYVSCIVIPEMRCTSATASAVVKNCSIWTGSVEANVDEATSGFTTAVTATPGGGARRRRGMVLTLRQNYLYCSSQADIN